MGSIAFALVYCITVWEENKVRSNKELVNNSRIFEIAFLAGMIACVIFNK